jgi:hypothetical protein
MKTRFVVRVAGLAIAGLAGLGSFPVLAATPVKKLQFTTDFRLQECQSRTEGVNPYFSLTPGRKLVLENEDGSERVEITVLEEVQPISVPGLGVVATRVVEERETADGDLIEVSRNFFAICGGRNDVVYFGEDVDIHNPDGSITHEGQWRAGQPDGNGMAEPGVIMPGTFLLGSRYFQEIADGIALDRAEHVDMGLDVETEAGDFHDCVRIVETTPLEPRSESEKIYCPGVGLVVDSDVQLVAIEGP